MINMVLHASFDGLLLRPSKDSSWKLGDSGQLLFLVDGTKRNLSGILVPRSAPFSSFRTIGYPDRISAESAVHRHAMTVWYPGVRQYRSRGDVSRSHMRIEAMQDRKTESLAALYQ